jgi:hypothetical protein
MCHPAGVVVDDGFCQVKVLIAGTGIWNSLNKAGFKERKRENV